MKEQIFKDDALETVFKQAVIDNFKRELEEIEKEPDVPVSERQQHRMASLLEKKQRRGNSAPAFVGVKKLASVAAALFIFLSGALLTVPEVRASVGEAIITWFDAFVQLGQGNPVDSTKADWHPTSLPDGFGEADNAQAGAITTIRYTNPEGEMLEFMYVASDNALSTNNEGVKYAQVPRDGVVYHTFTAVSGDYKSSVVWDADGYLFAVTGYLPVERLLNTAWSVERG
jgi:hypothetical protein